MSLATVRSRALDGLEAPEVTVEVHLANGLPSFTLVGLADTEVKEARERVRAALGNAGLTFPHNKRVTVNLAPADLPKESGRFDLPIAIGILAASGELDAHRLDELEFAGELSLGGELRPVRGALAMALALRRAASATASARARSLVLPMGSAREAALVDGVRILGAERLLDVVASLRSSAAVQEPAIAASAEPGAGWSAVTRSAPHPAPPSTGDLQDVKGQGAAKRALEIAAAAGHSLLMVGPPGTGKSMLAHRLASILPPLEVDEALESAAVLSLAGCFEPGHWRQRRVRTPHHSASGAALVGGGSPPRPGEVSLAHRGVLFLDELPEFPRAALEALREPLETGHITISRAARRHDFPARFQLVAAMNPCPCGHLGNPFKACRCTPDQVARYQGKVSGPLLDRIDILVEVPVLGPEVLAQAPTGESSEVVGSRVIRARQRQLERQGCLNSDLDSRGVDAHARPRAEALELLTRASSRLGWSGRGFHRVLRLARTLADLEGTPLVELPHVAEAIQCRRALLSGG